MNDSFEDPSSWLDHLLDRYFSRSQLSFCQSKHFVLAQKPNLFPTQMIFGSVVIIGHDATDVLNEEAHSSVQIAREF